MEKQPQSVHEKARILRWWNFLKLSRFFKKDFFFLFYLSFFYPPIKKPKTKNQRKKLERDRKKRLEARRRGNQLKEKGTGDLFSAAFCGDKEDVEAIVSRDKSQVIKVISLDIIKKQKLFLPVYFFLVFVLLVIFTSFD